MDGWEVFYSFYHLLLLFLFGLILEELSLVLYLYVVLS
jgi:hypothetical protein